MLFPRPQHFSLVIQLILLQEILHGQAKILIYFHLSSKVKDTKSCHQLILFSKELSAVSVVLWIGWRATGCCNCLWGLTLGIARQKLSWGDGQLNYLWSSLASDCLEWK